MDGKKSSGRLRKAGKKQRMHAKSAQHLLTLNPAK
jgi:hypothetical protein